MPPPMKLCTSLCGCMGFHVCLVWCGGHDMCSEVICDYACWALWMVLCFQSWEGESVGFSLRGLGFGFCVTCMFSVVLRCARARPAGIVSWSTKA